MDEKIPTELLLPIANELFQKFAIRQKTENINLALETAVQSVNNKLASDFAYFYKTLKEKLEN